MTDPRRRPGSLPRTHRRPPRAGGLFPSRRTPRPGTVDEPIFGLASDVAANIFVVLFLALAVALSVRHAPRVAETFDLTSSPRVVERTPLAPADLVAALFRRQAMTATSIDLLQDRMRLVTEGRIREWTWDRVGDSLGALSAIASDQGAIDLFVFDPHGYAFLQRALRGQHVIELSVPAALRACPAGSPDGDGCSDGHDWSQGYQHLFGAQLGAVDFRAALARLLSARSEVDRSRTHGGALAPEPRARPPVSDKLTPLMSERTSLIGLALFISVLAAIELIARSARKTPRTPD